VVHAPGLAEGTWLFLTRVGDEGRRHFFVGGSNATLDGERRARFEGLLAGAYVLAANGLPEEVAVTLPCGELYLDARAPDCLRVAIGDQEGALYRAGLRAGDLIVGAQGKDFDRAEELWRLFAETRAERIALSVLHGRERLELSLPVVRFGPRWLEELGGMLTPATRP
jgi:S1-C subfamily serine protease